MNNRSKMRRSNKKAVEHLFSLEFEAVYLIPHMRWDTISHFKNRKIKSKDAFGIADGFGIRCGVLYLLQVKSNSWNGFKQFEEFCQLYRCQGAFINVEDREQPEVRFIF